MTYDFTNFDKGIFCFFLIFTQWTIINSAESFEEIANFTENDKLLPRAKLGEYCWVKLCQENQFCTEEFICQCRSGFKVFNNDHCLRISGENESCTNQEDCWGTLICINGICRKSIPNNEFVILAKICLIITSVTIVVAVLVSLHKFINKRNSSEVFQRSNDTSNQNSSYAFRTQESSLRYMSEVQDDKPPSYEECINIHSTEGIPRGVLAQPPPYVIFTNSDVVNTENRPIIGAISTFANLQNLTPLNAQNLTLEANSNIVSVQAYEKNHSNARENL